MACLFLVNVLSLSIFHENSLKEQFIFKTIKNKVVAEAEKLQSVAKIEHISFIEFAAYELLK